MSEAQTAPAAPAATTAPPSGANGATPPPPRGNLSINDATRMMRGRPANAPDAAAKADGAQAQPAPQAEAAPKPAPAAKTNGAAAASSYDPADTMARALGLPDGLAQPTEGAQQPPSPVASLEVDGRQITADEVRRAMAHMSDYTKKTQALAAQARHLQQQQEALATVIPYIQPEIARLSQQLQGLTRPDPALIETNQQEYLRQQANYEAAVAEQMRLSNLTAVQQQANQRLMEERTNRSNEELAKEFPDWGDPTKRAVWQQALGQYAINDCGFTHAELQQLSDHRQLKLLMHSYVLKQLNKGATTRAPTQAPPARGAPPPPRASERIAAAEERLSQTHRWQDGLALLNAQRAK